MAFQKASKELARAKILITGPSGSGKTFSALRLAMGLGGRTAVIDTENNSASLYADQFPGWEYFVSPISPPYTAQKYFAAIDEAHRERFDVLIIDSATHLWAGEGGLLDQKQALDTRGGNSFTNWNTIGKLNESFKSKVLHSPIHIICTARSKQEYIIEANEKGKSAPKKVGLAPILRDGMEYEFTIVFDVGMDHQFIVSKDRTNLFDGVVQIITEKTGEQIKAWLKDDIQAKQIETPPQEEIASEPKEFAEARARREQNEADAERFTKQQEFNKEMEAPLDAQINPANPVTEARQPQKTDSVSEPQVRTVKNYAPGGDDRHVSLSDSQTLANYTIPFGRKYYGKTIAQVGLKAATEYADWMNGEVKKSGKSHSKELAEFNWMVNLAVKTGLK